MPTLARWCFRHRKLVLLLWIVAFVVVFGADLAAKPAYSTKFQLPNTDSTRALNILKANFPTASGESDQIVLEARHGTLRSPDVERAVTAMLANVSKLRDVTAVTSPYSVLGQTQVNKAG